MKNSLILHFCGNPQSPQKANALKKALTDALSLFFTNRETSIHGETRREKTSDARIVIQYSGETIPLVDILTAIQSTFQKSARPYIRNTPATIETDTSCFRVEETDPRIILEL